MRRFRFPVFARTTFALGLVRTIFVESVIYEFGRTRAILFPMSDARVVGVFARTTRVIAVGHAKTFVSNYRFMFRFGLWQNFLMVESRRVKTEYQGYERRRKQQLTHRKRKFVDNCEIYR